MDAGSAALVTISRLGLLSAARGGAHLALERVFQDPTIIPARSATDTVHPASGADV